MARLGVIDLGSNSVRLVVYEPKPSNAAKPFRTLIDEKKMAGLAAYVNNGVFTEAGIKRAESVLGDLLRLADNLGCSRTDIFATAVLRNCANSEAAASAIEAAIDYPLSVLPARDEAHLGFVGASIGNSLTAGTLVDIGGGSTELTALGPDGDHAGASIPFGCVLAYANYVRTVLPTPAECRIMGDAFRREVEALPNKDGYRSERLYGIGHFRRRRATERYRPRRSVGAVRPSAGRCAHLRPSRREGRPRAHPQPRARHGHPAHAYGRASGRRGRPLQVRHPRRLPHHPHAIEAQLQGDGPSPLPRAPNRRWREASS